MTGAMAYPLKFQIGARTLLTVRRRLIRHACTLDEVLAAEAPNLPALGQHDQGYVLNSLPVALRDAVAAQAGGLRVVDRQLYRRRYADLTGGFDAYLARFQAKARSTLLRKVRRFAEAGGGTIEVRAYRTADEMAQFAALARDVSRLSYQERLLDAGLPDGPRALAEMQRLAEADAVRAFLLFLHGRPVSYLYLPAAGDTLIYAYLGFDPATADLSPGTVLQHEAMRMLMEEGRFARLDFTEGEGQHKRLFATGGVDCADLLLLRPTIANLAVTQALDGFDRAVATAKRLADKPALKPLARALRR